MEGRDLQSAAAEPTSEDCQPAWRQEAVLLSLEKVTPGLHRQCWLLDFLFPSPLACGDTRVVMVCICLAQGMALLEGVALLE